MLVCNSLVIQQSTKKVAKTLNRPKLVRRCTQGGVFFLNQRLLTYNMYGVNTLSNFVTHNFIHIVTTNVQKLVHFNLTQLLKHKEYSYYVGNTYQTYSMPYLLFFTLYQKVLVFCMFYFSYRFMYFIIILHAIPVFK